MFSNNVANANGGAIDVQRSEVFLSSSDFMANTARGMGGGALKGSFSEITLAMNIFTDNSAPNGGGGAVWWEGEYVPVVLMSCRPGTVVSLIDGLAHCLPQDASTSDQSTWRNSTPGSLAEHGRWICKGALVERIADGNYAYYGPCVATGFHELACRGLPTENFPGYAGVAIDIEVLKLDYYGQIISSDSTSSLQMYPSLGSTLANDVSVSFIGSTFSVFQLGRAAFSVAVRPTFSMVSMEMGFTQLHNQPFAYFMGTDSIRGFKMATAGLRIHLASGYIPACRPGDVLLLSQATPDGQLGTCSPCKIGQYSVHFLSASCKKCPKVRIVNRHDTDFLTILLYQNIMNVMNLAC